MGGVWVEGRDAARHPTTHRTDPHNKGLFPKASISAEARSSAPVVLGAWKALGWNLVMGG